MKNYDNIEKHPFKNGYIGWTADGYARHIEKTNSSYGDWIAWPHKGEGHYARPVIAHKLSDMSVKLSKLNSLKEG